jgi:uncharacterized phage protein (TIGR02218 family)
MKAASTAVQNYLNALRSNPDAVATVADCYTFTLVTGLILTFTNADVPIQLNGYTYLANNILVDGLRYRSATGLDVDKQKISISAMASYTVGGVPFLQALAQGVFDGAEVQRERVFLDSWSPSDTAKPIGSVILFKGRVGTIDSVGRTSAEITVNSDLVLLDLQMPRNIYSPACQHVLYDSGCTMIKSAFGFIGTVDSGSTVSLINWSGSVANMTQGTITFSSGVNAGISVNIKSAVSGVNLSLSYPLYAAPSAGDTFTAYWGCDHTQTTCQSRFNNLTNFRGFPYVPQPTFALF